MGTYESLGIRGFDHVEFAVADLDQASELYVRMGFERVGTREIRQRQLRSILMNQNQLWILLSQSSLPDDPVARHLERHGEGVVSLAFLCEDAMSAVEKVVQQGARVADTPKLLTRDFGAVQQASIHTFGDVRHTFVSRRGTFFGEGFEAPIRPQVRGFGIEKVDHATCSLEKGQLDRWVKFYEDVFGLNRAHALDLGENNPGSAPQVMESPDGAIRLVLAEPLENDRVREYIDVNHGAGVQHLALSVSNLIETANSVRKEKVPFFEVPANYYRDITARVPSLSESIGELSGLGILVEEDPNGYLLQMFTRRVVGPFFYELIQRKGHRGFGEENIRFILESVVEQEAP